MKKAWLLVPAALLASAAACRRAAPEAKERESWSVTAWGERFEIFAEVEPLVAGEPAVSHTHVTVLADFSPLREGEVAAVLRAPGATEQALRQKVKERDGIYSIEIRPTREGEFDLFFLVDAPAGREQIAGGRVRVGNKSQPGGRVETGTAEEGISFLKEQQWRTEFATDWVRQGPVAVVVRGPARVRPAGGGETVLTASVDAVVSSRPWPFLGQALAAGATVFQITPQVTGIRSVAELEAEARSLEAEAEAARNRRERLGKLLEMEAVSRAEVERAEASRTSIEARLSATRRDLATARAARSGTGGGTSVAVRAPWASQVAEVSVSPGQTVSAGTALARLVKPSPVWMEVALTPGDAARLRGHAKVQGLFVRRADGAAPLTVPPQVVRVVSLAPEIDPRTATVTAILEVRLSAADLPFGTAAEADITLPGDERGIVIPATALVDDAGVPIAYVQLEGESFARREVRPRGRQGDVLAVDGLRAGERLVTRGGQAIRRASLLSTGAPEGHVH